MTYRQIKEYADDAGWDFSAGAYDAKVIQAGLMPDDPDSTPAAVWRWLNYEVLPEVNRTGHYEWPEDLDAVQPVKPESYPHNLIWFGGNSEFGIRVGVPVKDVPADLQDAIKAHAESIGEKVSVAFLSVSDARDLAERLLAVVLGIRASIDEP